MPSEVLVFELLWRFRMQVCENLLVGCFLLIHCSSCPGSYCCGERILFVCGVPEIMLPAELKICMDFFGLVAFPICPCCVLKYES